MYLKASTYTMAMQYSDAVLTMSGDHIYPRAVFIVPVDWS